MSQTTHCDICKDIIKIGITKFLLGLQEVTETNSPRTNDRHKKDMQEYLVKWQEEQMRGVLVYEICGTCKKILYHLFKMKTKERAKILKTLEDIYNRDPKKRKGWGQK